MTRFRKTLGAALLMAASAQASASLIGDTVACATAGPFAPGNFSCNLASAVVSSPASEFNLNWFGNEMWRVDIGASSIRLELVGSGGGFNWGSGPNEGVLNLSSLDMGSPITGLSVSTSGISNYNPATVSFTADSVRIDLSGELANGSVFWNPGAVLNVQLSSASVPEPVSWAVVGMALLALAISRRRPAAARPARA